mmetsp:Transcript_67828/g.196190  ORF Transcript_67828/g.196190 Transcript_67828/m.196190 type:complete len:392 (+) Transcript_67828:100-1275(+)
MPADSGVEVVAEAPPPPSAAGGTTPDPQTPYVLSLDAVDGAPPSAEPGPAAPVDATTAEDVAGVPADGAGDASPGSLTSVQQSSVDNSEIVLGLPITDNGTTRMIRQVIVLASLVSVYYVVHFVVNLLSGNYSSDENSEATSLWAATSSLLIELSIPACGYLGALYNNRQLTCCFCSCNLFIAVVSIMSFIRIHVRIGELAGNCAAEENIRQRKTCEAWMDDGAEKYLLIISTALIVLLGCTASWFGNALYNRLARDSHSLNAPLIPPLVGEVISLTPSSGGGSQGALVMWEVLGASSEAASPSEASRVGRGSPGSAADFAGASPQSHADESTAAGTPHDDGATASPASDANGEGAAAPPERPEGGRTEGAQGSLAPTSGGEALVVAGGGS